MSEHEVSQSRPSIGEAGATGDWRNDYPVILAETCVAAKKGSLTCQICWGHCPDACIVQGMPPVIDLVYCKGCGICAQVCPHHAIEMRPEAEHGVCATEEGEVR